MPIVCAAFVVLSGCNSTRFNQTHYVGVVNECTGTVHFYRFRLEGKPGWTKTKFLTGWYSADAIGRLLGEDEFTFIASNSDEATGRSEDVKSDGASKPEGIQEPGYRQTREYLITGPEGEGFNSKEKRFAIIMASDPTPFTDAIASLAGDESINQLIERRVQEKEKKKADEERKRKLRDEVIAKVLATKCTDPAYLPVILAFELHSGVKVCPTTAAPTEGDGQ